MTTPRKVTIAIPVMSCGWLSSNQRLHWRKKAHATAMWRGFSWQLATAAEHAPFENPVRITAIVHRKTNARADAHNLQPTVKAVIDGVVDSGLLRDDNDQCVVSVSFVAGEKSPQPYLELVIEEAA